MAELNLYQRLLAITDEIGKIEKTGRNSMQNYAFIEQARVLAELRPLLKKHGVVILPETPGRSIERYEVVRGNGKPGVDVHVTVSSRYTVLNADKPDEKFTAEWDAGEALDSSDKASNKAVTASHKTYLMKLFNISDQDDPDASHIDAPSRGQQAPPESPKSYGTSERVPSEKQLNMIRAVGKKLGLQQAAIEARIMTLETSEQASEAIDALQAKLDVKGGTE